MKKAVQIVFHRISLRCYSKRQSYKKKSSLFFTADVEKRTKIKTKKPKTAISLRFRGDSVFSGRLKTVARMRVMTKAAQANERTR